MKPKTITICFFSYSLALVWLSVAVFIQDSQIGELKTPRGKDFRLLERGLDSNTRDLEALKKLLQFENRAYVYGDPSIQIGEDVFRIQKSYESEKVVRGTRTPIVTLTNTRFFKYEGISTPIPTPPCGKKK